MQLLLNWQLFPVNPNGHKQLYWFIPVDWHIPPFKQGFGRQNIVGVWQRIPVKLAGHKQTIPADVIVQLPPFWHGLGLQIVGIISSHVVPQKLDGQRLKMQIIFNACKWFKII